MSNENRDTPPHTESTARRVKLDMPSLKADFKSRDVTRWLAGCEDAKKSAEWNYGGTIAPVHLIREAGSKMEGEGADWYINCRDKLKALKSWADFAHEVKARFVNEKTGLAAEHAFFNAHQSGRFSDFVATLTQERSQAGSVDGTPAISDELFKCQLLHRCDELLYLRATASPSFALSKFTVNGLVAYLQTMWEAITLERMTTGARRMNWRNDQVVVRRKRSGALHQSASIFLNGWLSAAFDILSGVRQDDPLAPSLFVLAIEGFACQIRLRVKGIEIAGLQNIRELLFADDACCALHNLSDLDHLNRAIELYERASASKLSNAKSFLYPLGVFRDRPIAPDLGTWRLSDSQFRYLGIQVGVEIAEDAGWEDVKASTIARIRSIPMYDLPYAAKCSIINIYCYTKILYYSRFLPAPKSVVKEIEDAAMLVSRSRLCIPLDHGGFGLIDLPRRLAIDHAKWVFQLRAPDGCFTRHLFDIRIRLQAPNEPTPFTLSRPAPNQHHRPWIWIWWAYFCHPPPKWDHAVRKTRKLLPARWVRYFEAWASVTTLNPPELSKSQNLEQWATHVLYFPAGHGIQLSVNPTLFRGPDGEVMTPSSFVNVSKRHQVFIFPPIFPKGHQKVFDLPEQRWNAWWKALRKVRRVHSDAEDTGHLLSLGSLHPGSQVASPTSPHPNNRSASCVMCLSEAPECLAHLAVGCPFARRLWSALSPTPHPVFVDFLCRRHRFSSDLLEPITETDFEGLRASIQKSKGRLVSL
ncbi:BZ3500_MvSof-1268-A1-R1_Chr7-1g09130 [Microbotryum saponariae]|uniref:BZ3500_MvSof-1268-A1-R1_Chr7-1g09130 protein n=1 Tax=Microbotryum saponariae TaxID=289078 RepID=A0A2X0LCS6_9BASI|nr:BZ3501_MvSof-1269-A2-R1_Chr7-1g08835 [Microbotryum saponariae]SDA02860.1 BZ3500_MvSof-1268-A1-R1_Chr7-1g09130 [Microbotryum saponariae]